MQLKKNKNQPYYLQIKEMLKKKIQLDGSIANKLPPVRKIADELGVNPNTVLRAYSELGKDGIVSGSVGKGTFVVNSPSELKRQNKQDLLEKAIEHSLEEALALEFSIKEYENAVKAYVKKKIETLNKIKLVFIECNAEQLTYFTSHLDLDPHKVDRKIASFD